MYCFGCDGEFAAVACVGNRLQLGGVYIGGISAGDGVVGVSDIVSDIDRFGAILPYRQIGRGCEDDIGRADSDIYDLV